MHFRVGAIAYGRADALAFSTAASAAAAATLRGLSGWIFGTEVNGLWKMPSLWKSANSADSHRDLEKSRKKQRDFSTFPTGPTGFSFTDVKTKKPGSETTLKNLIFCLASISTVPEKQRREKPIRWRGRADCGRESVTR